MPCSQAECGLQTPHACGYGLVCAAQCIGGKKKKKQQQLGDHALPRVSFGLSTPSWAERGWGGSDGQQHETQAAAQEDTESDAPCQSKRMRTRKMKHTPRLCQHQ
jgi:hypothetical protein